MHGSSGSSSGSMPAVEDRPSHTWPSVSVVVPTFNEARNLPAVLPRIPLWVHEVVLVDGGSTDGTVDVATRLLPDVRVVHQTGRGKGDALICGIAASTGAIVVTLDADGSADPEEIPAFVGALLSGAEFAKGTRFVQGGGTTDMEWYRSTGNHGLRLLARLLFGATFSDLCYGYNAFWRDVVDRLCLDCDGFEIETLMAIRAIRADLRITEVASFEAPRLHGTSNLRTVRDGFRVLRTILTERVRPAPTPDGVRGPDVVIDLDAGVRIEMASAGAGA